MTNDRSLLEEMLSDENINKEYLQVVRNKEVEEINGMNYTELKEYLKSMVQKSRNRYEQESIS